MLPIIRKMEAINVDTFCDFIIISPIYHQLLLALLNCLKRMLSKDQEESDLHEIFVCKLAFLGITSSNYSELSNDLEAE